MFCKMGQLWDILERVLKKSTLLLVQRPMCAGAHIMLICCLLMSHECPAEEKVLDGNIKKMADGVGFEPTKRSHVCRFSRPLLQPK